MLVQNLFKNLVLIFISFVLISCNSNQSNHKIQLLGIFGDHMVLQRKQKIPLRGIARVNSQVYVLFNWHFYSTKTDDQGKWQIDMGPFQAGGPYKLRIFNEGQSLELIDILIGDLWLASGQSNMCWPVQFTSKAKEKIKEADSQTQIRFLEVASKPSIKPFGNWEGSWKTTNSFTVRTLSDLAYEFAKKINQEEKIPIGIVEACLDNSNISGWMSKESLEKFPTIRKQLETKNYPIENWLNVNFNLPVDFSYAKSILSISNINIPSAVWLNSQRLKTSNNKYNEFIVNPGQASQQNNLRVKLLASNSSQAEVENFIANLDQSYILDTNKNQKIEIKSWQELEVVERNFPTVIYNGLIAPITKLPIKGVLWYQGESDIANHAYYKAWFEAMVEDWRIKWNDPDLVFISIKLHDFDYKPHSDLEKFWQVQDEIGKSIKNLYLVSAVDLSSKDLRIHPRDKTEIGLRVADKALTVAY